MNRHSSAHTGRLVTGSGDALDIELELIGGRTLRMSSAGDELGAWPLEECRVVPESHDPGSFRIVVEGDVVSFTPVDVPRFLAMVDSWAVLDNHESRRELMEVIPVESVSGTATVAADDVEVADQDTSLFLFGSASPPQPAEVPEPVVEVVPAESDSEPVVAIPFGDEDSGDVVLEVERWDADVSLSDADDFAVDLDVVPTDFGDAADRSVDIDTPGPPPIDREPLADAELADLTSADVDARALPHEADDEIAVALRPEGPELDEASDMRARLAGSSAERLITAIGAFTAKRSDEDGEEFVLGPNTVAEDVITSQRVLRDHRQKAIVSKTRIRNAVVAGSVVVVLVLLALMAPMAFEFIRTYEGGPELPPTLPVVATTVAVTTLPEEPVTVPPSTTVPPIAGETILDRPSPEFVSTWNMIGGEIDQVLEFDRFPILGPFEERFTPYLRMVGEVRPDGTMREFALIIDPSGPPQYDRIGIQAMGVAIATVDPSRSPEGRATLLGNLGLNVRRPTLGAIDGRLESNGLLYTLVYDAEVSLLTLTVSSVG